MPQIWTSDNTDAIARLKIQYGTSLVYPPSTMGAHVSAIPNHQTQRATDLAIRGNALQQLAGFSGSAVAMIRRSAQLLGLADLADGEAVFDAINQKEPQVWALFTAYCREIACVILNVQAVIDLERFVIGGGISAQAIVVEEIDRQYQQLLASLPILQQTLTKPEIQACKFQNDANLLGALYHFFLEHELK